jgi:hypothetical protein
LLPTLNTHSLILDSFPFLQSSFPEYLLVEIKKAGFEKPSAIQSQGWPMALTGRDIIGIAATGSGKTLGFLLPSVVHINAQPLLAPGDGPIVLCLSPTRELANQTLGEVSKFGHTSRLKKVVQRRVTRLLVMHFSFYVVQRHASPFYAAPERVHKCHFKSFIVHCNNTGSPASMVACRRARSCVTSATVWRFSSPRQDVSSTSWIKASST